MIKYDKLSDRITYKGKPITPKHKDFLRLICEHIIKRVENGESLADVAEVESQVFPSLATILSHIDGDKKLSEMRERAEKSRLTILKEQVLEMANVYKKNPCQENKDAFVGLEKLYSTLSKQSQESETVILKFNRILADDFWTGKPPEPVNPKEIKNGK